MNCRVCGDVLDPRRTELGYDYCLKEDCQRLCLKGVKLASVGINKAADYYMSADEVDHPQPLPSTSVAPEEEDETAAKPDPPRAAIRERKRPMTTVERLRALEHGLDRDLRHTYERFESGEITAGEMERQCDRLTADFNKAVLAENIRYRSMLRPRRARTR